MWEIFTKYWIDWVFGIIAAALTAAYASLKKRVKADRKKYEAMEQGMQALLRTEIIKQYNHYMDKGHCPIYASQNIESLYTAYHALGGNGTITKLYNTLKELPTDETGKDDLQ